MIIIKAYVHTYIANKNDVELGGGGLSFKTLWFYKLPVIGEYELLKKNCNKLQVHNMVVLAIVVLLNFIFG